MPLMRTRAQHYQEPTMEDLRREIQWLQFRVDEAVKRFRESPHSVQLGLNIDLPAFEGMREPEEFIDWIQTVEQIFEYKEVPEDKRVKLVASKLTGRASLWWKNLKRDRLREGRSKIVTWAKMSRELQREYLPIHYRQDMLFRCHQQQKMVNPPAVTPTSGFPTPPVSRLPVASVGPKTPDVRRSDRVSATSPAQKFLSCHGFGHSAFECTTENLIFFPEEGEAIEVEEKEEQTLGEDLIEESQLHADEEEPLVLQKEFLHIEPIMKPEVEEKDCELSPPHQPTMLTDLTAPHRELIQWEDTVVKGVVLVLAETEPFEIEPDFIPSMILPTESHKEHSSIPKSSNRKTLLEYKYLPTTTIPKVDLAWTKIRSRKVSVDSISKLRFQASDLTSFQGVTATLFMMKTSPPLRENDRGRSTTNRPLPMV